MDKTPINGSNSSMKSWPNTLHNLSNPPIVETAISVQFTPIEALTSSHIGWYWKNFLDESWVKVQETPALEDQFEKFNQNWKVPAFQLALAQFDRFPVRLQISNAADDRVIQIQNTRFIYNWRKRETEYPSFRKTFAEFSAQLEEFRAFLRTADLGDIHLNQWELSYIDHIPKGNLWQVPGDFWRVLPGLYPESHQIDGVTLETASCEKRFEITPKRGRVHVSGKHGKLADGTEILILHFTARGPIDPDQSDFGLGLGHEAIGRIFLAIVSEAAIMDWEGK